MKKTLLLIVCSVLCANVFGAMYITGTANPSGSAVSKSIAMQSDGCTYTWYGVLSQGTLKFVTEKTDNSPCYVPTSANKSITLNVPTAVTYSTSASTNSFSIAAGEYTLSLDTQNNMLTVIGTAGQQVVTGDNLFLIGPSTSAGWNANEAILMTKDENVYTYTGTFASDELKFLCRQGSWAPCYVATSKDQQVETGHSYNLAYRGTVDSGTPDYKFIMPSGNFTLTIVLNEENHTGTLTVSGSSGPTPGPSPDPTPGPNPDIKMTGLQIVGDFSNPVWVPVDMEEIGNGIFSFTGNFENGKVFKFRWSEDWWPGLCAGSGGDKALSDNVELPMTFYKNQPSDSEDTKWFFSESGEKTVFVDLNKLTVSTTLHTSVDTQKSEYRIYSKENVVYIEGAKLGSEYAIMNTIQMLDKGVIDSDTKSFVVPYKGVYIISVNGVATKLLVRF